MFLINGPPLPPKHRMPHGKSDRFESLTLKLGFPEDLHYRFKEILSLINIHNVTLGCSYLLRACSVFSLNCIDVNPSLRAVTTYLGTMYCSFSEVKTAYISETLKTGCIENAP